MSDLDFLRTVALLHDIGKPGCWASGGRWSEHIQHTFDIVRGLLDEEHAWTAMSHHTGRAYDEKYHPRTPEQWTIWLADNISSGTDRSEQPEMGIRRPSPPYQLSHPLSDGSKILESHGVGELQKLHSSIVVGLKKTIKENSEPDEVYRLIYTFLESSNLQRIPADTRKPINDVSLWHHSKLTAAVATCIHVDGGWRGTKPQDYSFALVSGDGDGVSRYVMESTRLPDLNARSEKVRQATQITGDKVSELVGPECVLFAGGGSLLALCPTTSATHIEDEVCNAFEDAMDGEVGFTTSHVTTTGDELQGRFGAVWENAGIHLRDRKIEKPLRIQPPLEEDTRICDVCHRRAAEHEDPERMLPLDASPRPEALCKTCWNLRQSGKGIWLDNVVDDSGYMAIVKADGDNMERLLRGDTLRGLGKQITPSRLSALSNLINDTCEMKLNTIIEKYNGRTIFAGGDDILALVPGEHAFDAALELSYSFREAMNEESTLSAGIAIAHRRLPIYAGLEKAHNLIAVAKENPEKNSVAYSVVGSVGENVGEESALKWEELDGIMRIVAYFQRGIVPNSQIRRIASTSRNNPLKAEAWIKTLIGRGNLPLDIGKEMLGFLESGRLGDAFVLYNLFKVNE